MAVAVWPVQVLSTSMGVTMCMTMGASVGTKPGVVVSGCFWSNAKYKHVSMKTAPVLELKLGILGLQSGRVRGPEQAKQVRAEICIWRRGGALYVGAPRLLVGAQGVVNLGHCSTLGRRKCS